MQATYATHKEKHRSVFSTLIESGGLFLCFVSLASCPCVSKQKMSYYIGYSQREIYRKRCDELGCACNSAVIQLLSDVPGEVTSLTSLDLSRNFLGRKGVIPLLDVIESAAQLRSLDLRDQQLGNDTVEVICARLRRHPSLLTLNLSNNPITLAISSALLELASQNTVLQNIYLENTLVRPSMVTAIEVQLGKNRALANAASAVSTVDGGSSRRICGITSSATGPCAVGTKAVSPLAEQSALPTAAGGGKSAAAMLRRDDSTAPIAAGSARPRQCIPAHELQHVLRSYNHSTADCFFYSDPTKDVWAWCEDRHYVFEDDQFSSHNDHLHRTARHTYGIAGWRRVGELYPDATLFGCEGARTNSNDTAQQATSHTNGAGFPDTCQDTVKEVMGVERAAVGVTPCGSNAAYVQPTSVFWQLPTDVPEGFTWIFTVLMASLKEVESLYSLFCASSTEYPDGGMRVQRGTACPGIYTMRVFVDGQWRYLLVDDFLPVDKYGQLIFTKPSMDNKAFWPCLFEKALAKLHGGYHFLDSQFDKHHDGIDGPNIRKHISWLFLEKENSQRANSAAGDGAGGAAVYDNGSDTDWHTVPDDSLICEEVAKNCGRIMSRLTKGLYDSYRLHPVEEVPLTLFEELHKVLGVPLSSANVRGGNANPLGGRQTESLKRSFLASCNVSVDVPASVCGVPSYMIAAIAFSRDASRTCRGIHPRCAYEIVRVCHAGGVRLLEMRNPWCGTEKWTGDWADGSPLWKMNPEVAELLLTRGHIGRHIQRGNSNLSQLSNSALTVERMSFKRSLFGTLSEMGGSMTEASLTTRADSVISLSRGTQAAAAPAQKSTFWMSYTDFLQNFEWVHTCRVFGDEFHRQDVHGAWTRDSAGGNAREPSWYRNPHYRFSLPYRATVYMQLTRRDRRLHQTRGPVMEREEGGGGIALELLCDTHYPLHCPTISRRVAETNTCGPLHISAPEDFVTGNEENERGIQETMSGRGFGDIDGDFHGAFSSLLFSEERQIGNCLSLGALLDAGTQYWIVPSTCTPRVLDEFDLVVISTSPFILQAAQESQYWDRRTIMSELLFSTSARTQQAGPNEGEVAIVFDSRTRVSTDANLVLQNQKRRCSRRFAGSSVKPSLETESATFCSAACRVVVAVSMDLVVAGEETINSSVEDAYDHVSIQAEERHATPTLQLAIVPGELGAEGRPTRVVGKLEPLTARTYVLDRHTLLETVIMPANPNTVEHYTAICSLHPEGSRARVEYRVWCSAPLLEVMDLPMLSKQDVTLMWDDENGSGNYYEGTGHPQVELSKLRPFQRFAISMRMLDYDTIKPAIMFSVICNDQQQGEPVDGRLGNSDVLLQSAYVHDTYVQDGFHLDEQPPESLIIIPCLQPTGTKGRCLLTISSDSEDYCVYPLRRAAAYPL
ncbi:calpain-like cysteine peptidase, putative [Leishmania tarentolae]|uniref:Calpain-like cysteine peptidase, putative n=1 Tax=Leishmania tarentolae TaxID=5689 RepID=A0A640KP20_LEITA|nr:calpain-like cysteine peptidase, putative [Leishmania tarentolae]